MTDDAILQSVINPTASKDVDSDEDDVNESNKINWNQTADTLNTFIKFSEWRRLHNNAEIMKFYIIRNDFLKTRKKKKKREERRRQMNQTNIQELFKMASMTKSTVHIFILYPCKCLLLYIMGNILFYSGCLNNKKHL